MIVETLRGCDYNVMLHWFLAHKQTMYNGHYAQEFDIIASRIILKI